MRTPPKREPLLADKFLAAQHGDGVFDALTREFYEATRSNLREAKRFIFDEGAARYCAEMLKKAPRIVADAQDFAIPPCHRTYIELPFWTWYEMIAGVPADSDADKRIGYLIVGNEVRCLAENRFGVGLSPIHYHLNQPFTLEQETRLATRLKTSRSQFDLFYWGKSVESMGTVVDHGGRKELIFDDWQREGLRSLRASHSFSLDVRKSYEDKVPDLWDSFYNGSAGDLRNIIGLLLFLNRTKKYRYEREEPFQKRMIRNRPSMLLKHHVITMHVNPVPKLLKLAAGQGLRRRYHDVIGHFCHNKITWENDHDHDWAELDDPPMHWACSCGAYRWWRSEFGRGDKTLGTVTTIHKVKE